MDLDKRKIPVENKSLEQQTPGLDRGRRIRNAATRGASWARERPVLIFGALGGLALVGVGVGTWIYLRNREPERWHRRLLARLRELA
jgi:hypothetical protein